MVLVEHTKRRVQSDIGQEEKARLNGPKTMSNVIIPAPSARHVLVGSLDQLVPDPASETRLALELVSKLSSANIWLYSPPSISWLMSSSPHPVIQGVTACVRFAVTTLTVRAPGGGRGGDVGGMDAGSKKKLPLAVCVGHSTTSDDGNG